jgi:hypothetical protein
LPDADTAAGVLAHDRQDGSVNGALLYLGIVAIWAFVLIPRWLRRPHLLGGETAEPADGSHAEETDTSGAHPAELLARLGSLLHRGPAAHDDYSGEQADTGTEPSPGSQPGRRGTAPAPIARSKVIQARRRLLTMLLTLTVVAAACTYLKLTSWWVCVPPVGMLGTYLLLLREAALADAEHARWRAAEDWRVEADRQRAREEQPERTAQVIDISARLNDQLYDQYADATMRAVGD